MRKIEAGAISLAGPWQNEKKKKILIYFVKKERKHVFSLAGPWQRRSDPGDPGLSCHHGGGPSLSGCLSNNINIFNIFKWRRTSTIRWFVKCELCFFQHLLGDFFLNGRLCNDLSHHWPCHFQHLRR